MAEIAGANAGEIWAIFQSVYLKGPVSDVKKEALRGYGDSKALEVLLEKGLVKSLDSETVETEKGKALATKIESELYRKGAKLLMDYFPEE